MFFTEIDANDAGDVVSDGTITSGNNGKTHTPVLFFEMISFITFKLSTVGRNAMMNVILASQLSLCRFFKYPISTESNHIALEKYYLFSGFLFILLD